MTKQHDDPTDPPADRPDDAAATEGAPKLKLAVKRMRRLRSSIRGGASTDTWTSTDPSANSATHYETTPVGWANGGDSGAR
ncbi:MAG TPA: hypothetical protein VFS00_33955 [Polyangiaceae bacterium]|nr:hypothetical protein [Polyangiaceae bacterium]